MINIFVPRLFKCVREELAENELPLLNCMVEPSNRRTPSYITNLAQHREDYERQKDNRVQRTRELQNQRQEIMKERERLLAVRQHEGMTDGGRESVLSSDSALIHLSAALERAKNKVPHIARNLHFLKQEEESRKKRLKEPYRGELGAGSYEPWQLDDFYFVREFVCTWVEEVLDFIVFESSDEFRGRMKRALSKFQEDVEEEETYQQISLEVADIEMSIINEVMNEEAIGIADERLQLCGKVRSIADAVMLEAVLNSSKSRKEGNSSSLVEDAYRQMKKERQKRGDNWLHTQGFQFHGNDEETESGALKEDVFSGIVLSFHDIKPCNNIPDREMPPKFLDYKTEESKIWAKISPVITTMPLNKRYRGFSCSALTSDHSFIALGSVLGDIVVWDLMVYPPRIIRSSKGKGNIVELQWSFDFSRLISLNEQGTVQVWSLKDSISVMNDVNAFEPIEENLGFRPSALVNILMLDTKHLFFTAGPFVGSTDLIRRAGSVAFHPSVTLLGKQEYIMVGLENGNIMRIHVAGEADKTVGPFSKVAPNNGVTHKVGEGLEAELFKSHKHPIVSISFVSNSSTMVSVDDKGFINLWEYEESSLTGFGWFAPVQQYRLDMSEITYKPAPGVQEKVHFTDAVKGKGRRAVLRREDMIQHRKEMQTQINLLHLGKPWTKEEADDTVLHVYAPKNVPESGATFHCITYYKKSGLLASYTTHLFRPCKVPCSRLLSCKPNPSGTKLVFMLLFPEVTPRGSQVTFVIVNLVDMMVCQNRAVIDLTSEEHNQCKQNGFCSFSITNTLDVTGSEYIIYNIHGMFGAVSAETGSTVMAESREHWVGCHISLQDSNLVPSSKLQVASTPKGLTVVCYAARKNTATLVDLVDKNSQGQRRQVWRALKGWQQMKKSSTIHREGQTSRRLVWTFSGHTAAHAECAIQTMILDLADTAIQLVDGSFDEAEKSALAAENRQLPYVWRSEQV